MTRWPTGNVLAAAVTAVLREGCQVPMATIAAAAGVGIGTLYRCYPTCEALPRSPDTPRFPLLQRRSGASAAEPEVPMPPLP